MLGEKGNLLLVGEQLLGEELTVTSDDLSGFKCKFQWHRVYLHDDSKSVTSVKIEGAIGPWSVSLMNKQY